MVQTRDVDEYLAVYLNGPGKVPGIGAERGRSPRNGLGRFRSPHGSTRYVWYVDAKPVSALQVVSQDGKLATIANVYTEPSHRRMGFAKILLDAARKDFKQVKHASDSNLSPSGRAWRDAT